MSWTIEDKSYSERRASGLIGPEPKTYRYASTRGDDVRGSLEEHKRDAYSQEQASRILARLRGEGVYG